MDGLDDASTHCLIASELVWIVIVPALQGVLEKKGLRGEKVHSRGEEQHTDAGIGRRNRE